MKDYRLSELVGGCGKTEAAKDKGSFTDKCVVTEIPAEVACCAVDVVANVTAEFIAESAVKITWEVVIRALHSAVFDISLITLYYTSEASVHRYQGIGRKLGFAQVGNKH